MNYTSTITKKGQVTVPKEFRDYLGFKPGYSVSFIKDGEDLKLKTLPSLESMMGVLKTKKKYDKKAAREAYIPAVIAGRI